MKKRFVVGIDLGGTNLKGALLDHKCRILFKTVSSTKNFSKKESLIRAICGIVEEVLEKNSLFRNEISGVGLGLPGPIDHKAGIVHFLPNIPGWSEVPLKKILEKRLGVSVFLDNDAKLMTLAEYRLGAGRKFKNILCLTLGTGVGGGVIINGRLYRGLDNASGEIGHLPINERGPRCNCGGWGCLESYVGNSRILKEAKRRFGRDITLEELSRLAQRKNKRAKAFWAEVARQLATALTGAVNLLNPDAVIIGGGVASAGRVLFDHLREAVKERAMAVQSRRVKILKAQLGQDAGLVGAALLAWEEIPRLSFDRDKNKLKGRAG